MVALLFLVWIYCTSILNFLNQARAGLWPAHAWFLRIAFVREVSMRVCVCVCVCVCVDVCVSAPKAINKLWCDLWRDVKPE